MSDKKILVVEDDQTTLALVCKVLSDFGYEYIQAKSGKEALEQTKKYNLKAILLDWMLPEMNGNEVLEKLKEDPKTRAIPVIMLTSKNNVNDVSEILEKGALDYIVKPFDPENLIVRLKNAINRSR